MANNNQRITQYQQRLKLIIRDLENVEFSLRNDFKNIGNEEFARHIHSVVDCYKKDLTRLENLKNSCK